MAFYGSRSCIHQSNPSLQCKQLFRYSLNVTIILERFELHPPAQAPWLPGRRDTSSTNWLVPNSSPKPQALDFKRSYYNISPCVGARRKWAHLPWLVLLLGGTPGRAPRHTTHPLQPKIGSSQQSLCSFHPPSPPRAASAAPRGPHGGEGDAVQHFGGHHHPGVGHARVVEHAQRVAHARQGQHAVHPEALLHAAGELEEGHLRRARHRAR